MIITTISDTHTLHEQIAKDLPGGDLLLCSGDISSRGYIQELKNFFGWIEKQDYHKKVFIAGNHDWGFMDWKDTVEELLSEYDIEYLEDNLFLYHKDMDEYTSNYADYIKIYGSPWQPEFYNWAFNLPRQGEQLKEKWDSIPMDTEILLTHGPAWGHLDVIKGQTEHLGCELLAERIKIVKPKIHIFGHIHSGYGYKFENGTHFINASVLNEQYRYTNKPFTFSWDQETNGLEPYV